MAPLYDEESSTALFDLLDALGVITRTNGMVYMHQHLQRSVRALVDEEGDEYRVRGRFQPVLRVIAGDFGNGDASQGAPRALNGLGWSAGGEPTEEESGRVRACVRSKPLARGCRQRCIPTRCWTLWKPCTTTWTWRVRSRSPGRWGSTTRWCVRASRPKKDLRLR